MTALRLESGMPLVQLRGLSQRLLPNEFVNTVLGCAIAGKAAPVINVAVTSEIITKVFIEKLLC